jgi:hypothetical protein
LRTRQLEPPDSATPSETLSAGAVVAAVVGEPDAVERGGDAAALAAPGLEALADGDGRDQQADDRVEPPSARDGVGEQADE